MQNRSFCAAFFFRGTPGELPVFNLLVGVCNDGYVPVLGPDPLCVFGVILFDLICNFVWFAVASVDLPVAFLTLRPAVPHGLAAPAPPQVDASLPALLALTYHFF